MKLLSTVRSNGEERPLKAATMKPSFTLSSAETGTLYSIYVAGGAARRTRTPSIPVLWMDGDDQFPAARAAYRKLRVRRQVPPLLLVGIGYGASYMKPGNKRGRDYTPTHHSDEPSSGGAEKFFKFIQGTLWPELNRRYRLHPKTRGIAGHSLGSLLVLYALFRSPLFFTHYLASAPSIWWDERSILRIAHQRRSRSARLPAQLFLSVGEKDTESMRDDLQRFEEQLAAKPFRGLRVTSRRFPRRNHYDVMPTAFADGLAVLGAAM